MQEPENIDQFKQILEAALLTAGQPLSIDDMLKLFAGRMERTTLRMLLPTANTAITSLLFQPSAKISQNQLHRPNRFISNTARWLSILKHPLKRPPEMTNANSFAKN